MTFTVLFIIYPIYSFENPPEKNIFVQAEGGKTLRERPVPQTGSAGAPQKSRMEGEKTSAGPGKPGFRCSFPGRAPGEKGVFISAAEEKKEEFLI